MDSTPQGPPPGTDRPKNPVAGASASASASNNDVRRTSSSSLSQPPPHATASPPAAMASSSSRAGRGNTPTASRSASKLVDADARPASRDSLKQKMLKQEAASKKDDAPAKPSRSDEQLKALKADFDSLRQHLTCKICDRLLYQPYTVACGHTYCYSCLCRWFVDNKARKTCPDCRVPVKELPAPAYVIRDMTALFVGKADLLPPDETIQDHKKWQKEEDDAVQADKDNKDPRTGGLFKGCFRQHARGPSLQVVRDQEDGVDRCPICTWELEDGGCQQCGLIFDETGEVSWGDSFSGFSDMDEMSEHNTEDLDGDMDMDDQDYDGYDDALDWGNYLPEQGSFMMRRFLEAGGIPPNPAAFARRRPVTHSEAGSRRSYSQSIVSDMYGDEMETLEEEDEEGLDDEDDSEMNDFIDDEEIAASSSASAESSTPGATPQPASQRSRARARPVVEESETSSTISSVIEEEEEDEEDEGPVRRGTRNSAQARALHRANGRPTFRAPSSTASHASTEELDEDTQGLLHEHGWMLQQDDDEMGEDDEDDSDGGRTTVGWEPLANSNDRSRMGGSLTPTADRPRPSAPIRPPSRTGNIHALNASRGLRRRSSMLSTSMVNYEDGEADDDDSDQDGDLNMAMNSLRTRRSQQQLRNAAAFANPVARFINQEPAQVDGPNDQDTDENSDNSQLGTRRRNPRIQRREYDPRISWMFAAHQQALQQHHMAGALIDVESRAITPISRPRTRNRNGPSPAQGYSPFGPPTRLRTPLMDNTSNIGGNARMPMSPPRRSAMSPALPGGPDGASMGRSERASSISSSSNNSTILTPGTSTPASQHSIDTTAQLQAALAMDMIDRPISRVSARPSSAAGRRNSAGFSPVNPSFAHPGMGLHAQGSALPPFQARGGGNPWAGFLRAQAQAQAQSLRARSSRQVLRNESSTATLRPASSRANMRDPGVQAQTARPQASRINLRPQPSRRQLNPQASTRTLRASEHARPPPSPAQNASASQPATRPRALTQDERNTRARELIETRTRALVQPGNVPPRNNPFYQRPANPMASNIMQAPPTSQHIRSNSNESMQSVNSNGTVQGAPSSPGLTRRRSNRSMLNAPPPGVLPPNQAAYTSPVTAYSNQYYRQRPAAPTAYESSLNTHARAANPVMAGNLI